MIFNRKQQLSWQNQPFDICLNQGRLVGGWITAEEGCEGGGNCLKRLKGGRNRKEGKGNKNFKKRGQAGPRGGCLKKGGWNPLMNNVLHI